MQCGLPLVNLPTEPVSAREVRAPASRWTLLTYGSSRQSFYDMRSVFGGELGWKERLC